MSTPMARQGSEESTSDTELFSGVFSKSRRHQHIYELGSFDMIVMFLTMTGFIAMLSPFEMRLTIGFIVNTAAVVLVRVAKSSTVKDVTVCFCATLYCFLIATQPTPAGPTLNYLWGITFIFILGGFRFAILLALVAITGILHIVYLQIIVQHPPFHGLGPAKGVAIDLGLFTANFLMGLGIYASFFALGQIAWQVRLHPLESLEAFPNIRAVERAAFARLPMALLLTKGTMMSDEQHLFFLLRIAQHSDYRDVLLEAMRPTSMELEQSVFTTARWGNSLLSSTVSGLLKQKYSLKQPSQPRLITSPVSNVSEQRGAHDEDPEPDFQGLRRFLRSALIQLFLETHPNHDLCDALLDLHLFHCSRQQIESALLAYTAKQSTAATSCTASPRVSMNQFSVRLWSSSDRRQRRVLPASCQDIILRLPEDELKVLTNAGAAELHTLPVTRQNLRRIKRLAREGEHVQDISTMLSSFKTMHPLATGGMTTTQSMDTDARIFSYRRSAAFIPDVRRGSVPSLRIVTLLLGTPSNRVRMPPPWSREAGLPSLLHTTMEIFASRQQVFKDHSAFPQCRRRFARSNTCHNDILHQVSDLTRSHSVDTKSSMRSELRNSLQKSLTLEIPTLSRWDYLKLSIRNFWNFHLPSPIKRGGYMPLRTLLGTFTDSKIERWYLVWACSVQAVLTLWLRFIHLMLLSIQLILHVTIVIVEHACLKSLGKTDAALQNTLSSSTVIFTLLLIIAYVFFYQHRHWEDPRMAHVAKLHYLVLGITSVTVSVMSYFVSCIADREPSIISDAYVLTNNESLKEALLFLSLLSFPLMSICTEVTTVCFISVAFMFIFIVAPLLTSSLHLWPIYLDDRDMTLSGLHTESSRFGSYLTLFHTYAPCLIVQFVMARAVQGTLRRLFVRSSLLYLLYLDAMGPPYGEAIQKGRLSQDDHQEDETVVDTGGTETPLSAESVSVGWGGSQKNEEAKFHKLSRRSF